MCPDPDDPPQGAAIPALGSLWGRGGRPTLLRPLALQVARDLNVFGKSLIGRIFGIPVYASGLLLMLLGVVAILGLMGDARILALTLLLLTSVFLHELGHALVARRHGIQVVDIILGPLVCSARMTEIPERARVEASIAIAGPATNFLLALLALPLLLLLQAPAFGTVGLEYGMWFIWVNVILGAFNLLPGFPMDGGRLLRSLLAARMGWLAATERAVQVGRVVAIALAIAGLFFFPRALLLVPLLAIYLWIMGTRELWVVRQRHGRSPLTGEPLPQGFGPFAGAFNAAGGFGTPFGGFGGFTARPTADGASEYIEAPHGADVEPTPAPSAGGARRPRTIDVEALSDETRSGGISDDAVRKLESFRGRLRRPNQD